MTAAAGSDTPWGSTIGEVRTYVHTGAQFGVDAWFRNLKAGHTFVSNGPALEFTVDDALPGTELTRSPGARVRIRARARGHAKVGLPAVLRIEGSDGVVKEVRNTLEESDLTIEFDHTIDSSQWLMADVVCNNDPVAHTTPVYIVVNGRPTWNTRLGPGIIDKQIAAIGNIETELAKQDDDRTRGLRERLQHARSFYGKLRERMA